MVTWNVHPCMYMYMYMYNNNSDHVFHTYLLCVVHVQCTYYMYKKVLI